MSRFGIGMGLRTKINASIGTSTDIVDVAAEVRKARAADAARIRQEGLLASDAKVCTMCGEFCANRASNALFADALEHSAKA